MEKSFKKILLLVAVTVMVVVCFAFSASALSDTGKCGENVSWNYNSKTNDLVISGTGATDDYYTFGSPFSGSYIKNVVIEDGVTTIGNSLFSACDNLESVTIPDSVKSIGDGAFNGCSALISIRIPDEVTSIGNSVFYYCSMLGSITIPDKVTAIGDYVFYGCKSLSEITLGRGIKTIGESAFEECTGLEKIYAADADSWLRIKFGGGNSNPVYYAKELYFDGKLPKEIVIPNGVTEISEYAFKGCESLRSVAIPDSVTSIGSFAFSDCVNLSDITMGDGVDTIGMKAFSGCSSLVDIVLGSSVEAIEFSAFSDCERLVRITIPETATWIDDIVSGCDGMYICCNKNSAADLFASNYGYNCIYLDASDAESIVSGSIRNFSWSLDKRTGVLEFDGSGIIPDFINDDAPWKNYASFVRDIVISEGVTRIGSNSFKDFYGLRNISLPDSVAEIGERAFYGCSELKNLTVGKNLEQVDELAFYYHGEEDSTYSRIRNLYIPDTDILLNIDFVYDDESYAYNFLAGADNLFAGNEKVTEITVPDGVTEIKEYLFAGSDWLESIVIGEDVISVGNFAFYRCRNLKNIEIGGGVASVGNGGFSYCENLETVTFGYDKENTAGITAVPKLSHTKIKELTLPVSVEIIGESVFPATIETVTVYNPDCEISSSCGIGYTHTIIGYKGSTAEAFADKTGADFIDIETVHTQHSYKAVPKEGYCFFERCYCGEEKITAHSYILTSSTNATCTTDGIKTYTCSCGDFYSEKTEATGHTLVADSAVDSTCTASGLTEGSHCSSCKTVILAQKEIPAKGHSVGATYLVKATEGEDGKTVTLCSACGRTTAEKVIPAISSVKLSGEKYAYNGKAITPSVTVKDSKGKVLVLNKDYTVSFSSGRKNAGKYTVTVKFKGNYSGSEKLSFKIVPQTPSVLKISSVTESSLKISWNAVSGATGYRVYEYNPKTKKYQSLAFVEGKTYLTVSSLSSGAEYKFKVRAYAEPDDDSTFWSSYSSEVSAVTKLPAPIISKLAAGKSQLTANWKALSGVTGYEVEYSTSKKFTAKTTKKTTIKKAKTAKTTLKKLAKGKKYYVRMRAYKTVNGKAVYSAWSVVKNIKVK